MILISINNKDYELPNQWSDISIKDCVSLNKLIKLMPEFLKDYYTKGTSLTLDQIEHEAPLFYNDVIKCLLKVEKLENCLWSDITAVYKMYCENLILELLGQPNNVEQIEYFTFKSEKYLLPKSIEVLGEKKLGATLSTIQFTEVADLEKHSRTLDGGIIEVMPLIIAILCLKDKETYIEDVSLVRSKKFEELPMSTAWSVFFSFTSCIINLTNDFLTSQKVEGLKR